MLQGNLKVSVVTQNGYKEHFISLAFPPGTREFDTSLAELFSYLKKTGAQAVMQLLLGGIPSKPVLIEKMKKLNGPVTWPVMAIDHDNGSHFPVSGIQVFAVSGVKLKEINLNGEKAGFAYEDPDFEYVLLSDMRPDDTALAPGKQTREVYAKADAALKEAGMDFSRVVRTWFYLDKLLDWYKEFNDARTGCFDANGIFHKLVPASTGIGASNPEGAALVAGFYALKPKHGEAKITKVGSPLQCEAFNYKSAFSRAVEIKTGACRKLIISGTASIDPDGKSAFIGDLDKQIELTLKVVKEILSSRNMDWEDVTRSILYFKEQGTAPAFRKYCELNNIPAFPSTVVYTTVCREELLFEIELDAVK